MAKQLSVEKRIQNLKDAYEQRLANLAMELGYAGMQTLINDFSFTSDQAAQWLDKTLARAKANREVSAQEFLSKHSAAPRKKT